MKYLEDKLEELDVYFAPKKESEKWVIILGIAGVLAYFAYTYLLPYTEEMYNKSERTKKTLEKSIKDHNSYLKGISGPTGKDRQFVIKKYDKEIKVKKDKIVDLNAKIKFIDENLEKLGDMLFNKKSWSIFLNSITNKAEVQNVDLQYITNHYVDTNGSFGHVLEIGVGCKGNYRSIVKFMNELEQNVLVTDIFSTKFISDVNSSDIIADINISVWGINH